MTRTANAFTSTLSGAGLALALLTTPAAAQDARYWLNDATDCQVFRALNEVVPAVCAQPGDTMVEARTRGWGGKSRGISPRSIRLLEDPAPVAAAGPAKPAPAQAAASPAKPAPEQAKYAPEQEPAQEQTVAAVQQANPPATKSINARVQFEFDSFRLTDDAKAVLDRLAGVLNDDLMKDKVVEIEGHTDAVGPDAYNLTLSQLRARSVRAYLIQQHGIAPERLPFVGKGEAELYDPGHPNAAVNRRVMFTNTTG
jgi:outer membrane protein OmpA-like peptidoglycan-associated protein